MIGIRKEPQGDVAQKEEIRKRVLSRKRIVTQVINSHLMILHIIQFLLLHIDWFHLLYPNLEEVRDLTIQGSCQIMHMAIVLLLRLREIYNKVEIQLRIRNQLMRKILEISIVQNSLIAS